MSRFYDDPVIRGKLRLSLAGKSSKPGGLNNSWAMGQLKPIVSIPDGHDDIKSDPVKMRSHADKISRGMKLDGADRWQGGEFVRLNPDEATTPQHLIGAPIVAKSRPNSPFKGVKATPVIVRINK